jgi:hypothetical protein
MTKVKRQITDLRTINAHMKIDTGTVVVAAAAPERSNTMKIISTAVLAIDAVTNQKVE